MLVMANETFLVAPGYGAYGKLVCSQGLYNAEPGHAAFNNWWILTCHDHAHDLSYPKSKVWSYANLP